MKHLQLYLASILATAILLASCKKESEETTPNASNSLTKLKEGYAIGASARVEIWGKKNFFVGYNNLVIHLRDSLNPAEKISDAHITLKPVMTMGMGSMAVQHACPVENPDETAVDSVFRGAVVFTMSTENGSWKLSVAVHNHKNGKQGDAEFDISVENPANPVLTVFTSQHADSSKLVLALVQATAPQIGMNDIEFTIHKMVDMMHFTTDDSYTIDIAPEMPSMGHGSPNNVTPVLEGNGHYYGKVNFTMTGEWKVNVRVNQDGVNVSKEIYFNLVL